MSEDCLYMGGGVWLGGGTDCGDCRRKVGISMCICRFRCAGKIQRDYSSILTYRCMYVGLCIMGVGRGGSWRPPPPPPPLESGEVVPPYSGHPRHVALR